ncbi:hypothetical protein SEA_SPARCETUS_84 [Microbacterium phage Sparcetus]|nr:hypothetical protein SEA_SPARCETUS_84 [Microbacterium phage Sparcetus]
MPTPEFVNPALVAVNLEVARVSVSVKESEKHLEAIDHRIRETVRTLDILRGEKATQNASHRALLDVQRELLRGKDLLERALKNGVIEDDDEDELELEEL